MSTTMIDPPCPSNDRQFIVEAGKRDPAAQHQHERDRLIDREIHASRAAASQAARTFLHQGLWVEVYEDDTMELLAGPFDPDQAAPAYIV